MFMLVVKSIFNTRSGTDLDVIGLNTSLEIRA